MAAENTNEGRLREIMDRLESSKKPEDSSDTSATLWEEFSATFKESVESADVKLKKIENEGPEQDNLTDQLDEMTLELSKIQRFLNESISYLPVYEAAKCNKSMQDLNESFQEIQRKLKPKKKFGFKSRPKAAEPKKLLEAQVTPQAATEKPQDNNAYEIKGRHNITIMIAEEDINGKDILLSDLQNCRIQICGSPATLHLAQLKNSTLLADPVSTSVFLDHCTGSKLAVACQQLRMHSSSHLTVNIHVTSRGIIEDCSDIKFAPYSVQEVPEKSFKAAGLDPKINHWNEIQDFNWLSADEHSPNWSALTEDQWEKLKI